MNIKYKISIVTVVYNDCVHIVQTMRSVLNQMFHDYEYIIIDGSSKDGTIDCIKELIKGKHNVTFISEPDNGIYDAMNKAVMMAKGEWICFMNSGDTFYNNKVCERILPFLTDENDIVYGNTNAITEKGLMTDCAKDASYLLQNMPFCHQSTFTKTSLLKEMKYDVSYRFVADYNFFYHCYISGRKFCKTNEIIATYNTVEGFSAQNKMKVFKEVLRVRKPTDSLINKLKLYIFYYRFYILERLKKVSPGFVSLIRYGRL